MRVTVPSFYPDFHCLAGKCRHTCCAGWEIDIDPESRERYRHIGGAFGAALNASIDDDPSGAHFRLGAEERCPLLTADHLCALILHEGEEALCQVCADHPRYRNFFADHVEMGLGLCCEAAARLALTQRTPFHLIPWEDDGAREAVPPEEEAFFALRDELFALLQDRAFPLRVRLKHIQWRMDAFLPPLPLTAWAAFLAELESLDAAWPQELRALSAEDAPDPAMDLPLENWLACLFHRHLPRALEDGDFRGWTLLCVVCCNLAGALWQARVRRSGRRDPADFWDLVRLFSAEMEYSDENMALLREKVVEWCQLS